MASAYLCYGLNSHGLVKPNEKKTHPHCSYGHTAVMPYLHGSQNCPCEKLNSSLEPYPCDSQLYISHPVLFTHIICRIWSALSGDNSRKCSCSGNPRGECNSTGQAALVWESAFSPLLRMKPNSS